MGTRRYVQANRKGLAPASISIDLGSVAASLYRPSPSARSTPYARPVSDRALYQCPPGPGLDVVEETGGERPRMPRAVMMHLHRDTVFTHGSVVPDRVPNDGAYVLVRTAGPRPQAGRYSNEYRLGAAPRPRCRRSGERHDDAVPIVPMSLRPHRKVLELASESADSAS